MFMSADIGRQNFSKCIKCVPYYYILGMVIDSVAESKNTISYSYS